MKKVLLLISTALLFTTASNAQITKGKTLLGGTIAYGRSTEEYGNSSIIRPSESHAITINPSVGKFIKDNLVLGLQAGFQSQELDYSNSGTTSDLKSYSGGIFVRKYVPLLKSFYFFGQGTAAYARSNTAQKSTLQAYGETTAWDVSLSFYPGLTYAVTQKFYIEAGLNQLAALTYGRFKSVQMDVNNVSYSSDANFFNVSTSLGSNAGFLIGFRFVL